MRRVFKYTNALLAVLLFGAAAAYYFLVWRSLPELSGEFKLDVAREAKIERDEHGVPHIMAARIEDAVYLQGYVHAQDRFWQMEAMRRSAAGEMAEVVGQIALESDVDARRLRMRITANQMAKNLSEADRLWFAAYARGVNDWLQANQDHLPLEIRVLNFTPRAWSISDSLLLGLYMYRQQSTTWTAEADKAVAFARGDAAKLQRLFPLRSGQEIAMGSNAWALAGSRTQSGKPILAGDPHMEQTWPSTFYLNHLQAEDLDCIGGSLPGAPGIIIGHNQRIAWSLTNLHFDVQDLYRDPRIVAQQKETIRIRGRQPVEIVFPLTPHGPLLERSGQTLALRWPPFDGQYSFPFIELNRAKNWAEFRKALSRYPGPNQNFVYADVDGNIGYQGAGKMPIRKTELSGLPLDADKPDNEWVGYIPFEEQPTAFNPASGVLISANQNPFPADYKYPVAGHFTPPYRQNQIARRLASQAKWDAAGMVAIQKDVYSAFHHFLAQELARAAKSRQAAREGFAEAREILAEWNGQMEVGMAAPLLAVLSYEHLARAVLRRAAGGDGLTPGMFTPAVIEDLLKQKPKDWFDDYDQLLVESLLWAVEEGAKTQGKTPRFWDYGRYQRIYIPNLVLSQAVNVGQFLVTPRFSFTKWFDGLRVPLVDSYVMAGPQPLSGGSQTVKQVNSRLGQAMRFIADTSDWEKSYLTITLGQSGHAFAKHGKDYWDPYYNGVAVPLLYKKYKADATMRIRPLN